MPSFLFWNTSRKPVEGLLARLAREHEIDVIIVCENEMGRAALLNRLNEGNTSHFQRPENRSTRLDFYVRLPAERFITVDDQPGIAIRRFSPPLGDELLIVAVHLPSKLHASEDDQDRTTRFSRLIADAEQSVNHTRTIVIGDFNMEPFRIGLTAADGFHAVMDRKIALQETRRVGETDYPFFYNPMWSLLGDAGGRPSGTYFYRKSGMVSHFWHMTDQVLLRPSLLERFDEQSLAILTSVGGRSLADKAGRPDRELASDHFPVFFRLKD